MFALTLLIFGLLPAQSAEPPKSLEDNTLYQEIRAKGMTLGGQTVDLTGPMLREGASAEEEAKVLATINGGPRNVKEFLQDDKYAPEVMKSRDITTKKGTVVLRDLWFVIYAPLQDVDTSSGPFGGVGTRTSNEGGIKVTGDEVDSKYLAARKVTVQSSPKVTEGCTRETGDLFGEVFVEATNHVLATRIDDSWLVAFRTDPRFNDDPKFANRWRRIDDRGRKRVLGPESAYEGGFGYTKITQLKARKGALLVETHFAFWEPKEWFSPSTPLISKIPAAAKGHIKRLREEVEKKKQDARAKDKASKSSR